MRMPEEAATKVYQAEEGISVMDTPTTPIRKKTAGGIIKSKSTRQFKVASHENDNGRTDSQ
jgi:hypothetical protein